MSALQRTRIATTLPVCFALAWGVPVQAQMLEEVIVTATKREEGLQDVPIALAVMDGNKINEQGIRSMTDVAIFMPNVHVAEASAGDQLFIRGVGSGVNYGFEQSVGTFIDGVYFGRGQASRSAFLDLARVEVLKGSQSTLFGKNTIAGAINITTARPSDEFEVILDGSLEPEFDGSSGQLIVSGPITDTLGARFVIKGSETDGWMDNRTLGDDEVAREDLIGRLTMVWDASDTLEVALKYEKGEMDSTGSNEVIGIATPQSTGIYQAIDPNFTSGFSYDKFDATFDERGGKSFHDSEWDIVTLTAEWDIGDFTLKSITGWVDYEFNNLRDSDYSALKAIARGRDESHEQFTQEFLLSSPTGETFEYLAGLYYQDEELGHERFTDVSLVELFNAGAPLPAVAGTGIGDGTGVNTFNQDAETWSAFFQGTYNITDDVRVIGGIRYSQDQKEFDKSAQIVAPFDNAGEPSDFLGAVYDGLLNLATVHDFRNGMAEVCPAAASGALVLECVSSGINTTRSEEHWTGDVTVQWDATVDTMVYAKWGNGYKAGGFDEDNGRGNIPAQEYEDETSETIEIGAKLDLLEGRGRLNVAVFSSQYEDVQVSTFDGVAGFVVGNAAETEVDGLELDGMFAVTEDLTISYSFAYLDAKYKSYPGAGCTAGQTQSFAAGPDGMPGTADDLTPGDCTQDLDGQQLQFAADWSGNLGAIYNIALGDNLELNTSIDMMISDDYDVAADGDELLAQDDFYKINARIAIGNFDGTWQIAILGKNLTDEETTTWGNDVPLGSFGFYDTYFQIIDAPRSFELQARYVF
ncbi:MAG: TonB-dependent receptor [Halioglobus sp.]|nr:TonB-dependent receptor [Halioglobus sp.]